ncbi:MAG: hypothetical protein ABI471_08040 [Sphingomonas bacterium]
MRNLDFSSWQSVLATLLGLTLVSLLGVGIRLLMMMTFQQRRERMNRQINERLRTLIAAYKTLGGSFTGDLTVDPSHKRDMNRLEPALTQGEALAALDLSAGRTAQSERTRRIRDAVEGALSDIILLGTEEQVRLAEQAVRELIVGHPVKTHQLVVSLRAFVREALDLDPIPADLELPMQGPSRPSSSGGGGRNAGGKPEGGRGGGGGGAGGMGMSGGGGMGANAETEDAHADHQSPPGAGA